MTTLLSVNTTRSAYSVTTPPSAPPPRSSDPRLSHSQQHRQGGKTFAHSVFLQTKKHAQARRINQLRRNRIVEAEEAEIGGLSGGQQQKNNQKFGQNPHSHHGPSKDQLVNSLVIRGRDLFADDEDDEQGGVEEEEKQQSFDEHQQQQKNWFGDDVSEDGTTTTTKSKKKSSSSTTTASSFLSPILGPSLVLSTDRLCFSVQRGPIVDVNNNNENSGGVGAYTTSLNNIPGICDRQSRSVKLFNNGTTSVTYEWKESDGVLDASLIYDHRSLSSSSTSTSNLFTSLSSRGIILPGETHECVFTFSPSSTVAEGVFIRRMRLETQPKLRREVMEKMVVIAEKEKEKEKEVKEEKSDDLDEKVIKSSTTTSSSPLIHLTLTGSLSSIDTLSTSRARLLSDLSEAKTRRICQEVLEDVLSKVKDPPIEQEKEREEFWKRNSLVVVEKRDGDENKESEESSDPSLAPIYYYSHLLPHWKTLASDIFSHQKRAISRSNLQWNLSCRELRQWIESIPQRRGYLKEGLLKRYNELVEKSSTRPEPNDTRYAICSGIITQIASLIPSYSRAASIQFNTRHKLDEEVRKEEEERKKREEEQARMKLPYHMRFMNLSNSASSSAYNPIRLTAEQKRVRDEEAARVADALAAQQAEDLFKRNERNDALKQVTLFIEEKVKEELMKGMEYFDFLDAPQNTNLDPKAVEGCQRIKEEKEQAEAAAVVAEKERVEREKLEPPPPPQEEKPVTPTVKLSAVEEKKAAAAALAAAEEKRLLELNTISADSPLIPIPLIESDPFLSRLSSYHTFACTPVISLAEQDAQEAAALLAQQQLAAEAALLTNGRPKSSPRQSKSGGGSRAQKEKEAAQAAAVAAAKKKPGGAAAAGTSSSAADAKGKETVPPTPRSASTTKTATLAAPPAAVVAGKTPTATGTVTATASPALSITTGASPVAAKSTAISGATAAKTPSSAASASTTTSTTLVASTAKTPKAGTSSRPGAGSAPKLKPGKKGAIVVASPSATRPMTPRDAVVTAEEAAAAATAREKEFEAARAKLLFEYLAIQQRRMDELKAEEEREREEQEERDM